MCSSSTEDECGILFTIDGDINITSVRWYGRLKPQDSPGWLSLSEFKNKRRSISFCVFNWRCDKKIHKYWFVYFLKIRNSMLSVATWYLYTQLSFTKPPLNNIPPWGILRETITLLPTANYFGSAYSIHELHFLLLQFWCWKNEVFQHHEVHLFESEPLCS